MELKLKTFSHNFFVFYLLIVPYGIETLLIQDRIWYLCYTFNRTLWN